MNYALRWTIDRMRPAITLLPDDFFTRTHFERVLRHIDLRSSPGLPLCYSFKTNGEFLQPNDLGEFDPTRVELLWNLVQDWVRGGSPNPMRVFIKKEPHKLAKLEEGRLRLIMSISLTEQIIDHMLFGTQNEKEVELFDQIPCAPGWGITYGGWRSVDSKWIGLDRKAWDFSVPMWLLQLELQLRHNLCANATEEWRGLTGRRYEELYRTAVFQLSSGVRYRQCTPGIVKSGAVNTISTNTHCQLLLHSYAAFLSEMDDGGDFLAMGDDTCQDTISADYIGELNKIVRIKKPTVGEFCSFTFFRGGVVEPNNFGKHLKNLMHQAPEYVRDSLRSLQILYACSSKLGRIRQLVLQLEPSAFITDVELERLMN